MITSEPPQGTIQSLRTWRQASPAVVKLEPGYCVKAWISTPFSGPGSAMTPGWLPELRTPRQNGALLPGWLIARCALVSLGCGRAVLLAACSAALAVAEAAVCGWAVLPRASAQLLNASAAAPASNQHGIVRRIVAPW